MKKNRYTEGQFVFAFQALHLELGRGFFDFVPETDWNSPLYSLKQRTREGKPEPFPIN